MSQRLRVPERAVEIAFTLLRVVSGLLFAFHGVQKLFGVLTAHRPAPWTQVWIGGVLELLCGAAIAGGIYTRLFALLASGEMAVAYIQFHWKLAFDGRFFPAVNQGELAVVYAFLFLFVAARGGGRFSVDGLRRG